MYCQICGKYSGKYVYCIDCYNMIQEDNEYYDEEDDEYDYSYDNEKTECILCGNDSNNYLFCKSCYHKYKNKSVIIKLKYCKDFKIMQESYDNIYVCKDGHIVKSKSERDIDNFLYENGIIHAYEKQIIINGEKIKPDFYIPKLNLYIEHFGYDSSHIQYTKEKMFKLNLYKKAKITLICTSEKEDAIDIESALKYKLNNYEVNKINFLNDD